jgi:hypothetical protein
MHRLAASTAAVFALFAVASCQLSCNSQLRLLPQFQHLFSHCGCTYSTWSDWEPISTVDVPTSQCPSGKSITEERIQRVVSGGCAEKKETRNICEPELVDQIILSLGLGSSGHHISQAVVPITFSAVRPLLVTNGTLPTAAPSSQLRSTRSTCGVEQICHHVTTPRGKRSAKEELRRPLNRRRRSPGTEPQPLPVNPIPFSIAEHGARYRRQTNCLPNGMQHILFVLDTSGSISVSEFNRVTSVLSELVLFFCNPIKIAVMTFDHEYYVEFCFNCYDNTCGGRFGAMEAVKNIDRNAHRSGTRYTHTAGAAQCVCDFILSPTCGLDPTANCIDVVFLTDGKSNDPNLDVCNEINCLHNRFGVNTYAIGIDDASKPELECISEAVPGQFHLFNFLSFDDFEDTFQQLVDILLAGSLNPNGDPYVCIDPQAGVGIDPCI